MVTNNPVDIDGGASTKAPVPLTLPTVATLTEEKQESAVDRERRLLTDRLVVLLRSGDIDTFNKLRPDVGLDLKGVDLSRLGLKGVNFSRCDLSRANLSGCDLEGANLSSALLYRADLSNSSLKDANCQHAYMHYSTLNGVMRADGANFECAELVRADVRGANLSYSRFNYAFLNYANLTGAKLDFAELEQANLQSSFLMEASFVEANLAKAMLSFSIGSDISFKGANLVGAHALKCGFTSSHQKISETEQRRTTFEGAWTKGLEHDGFGVEDNLLKGTIVDREPPPGKFSQRQKPEEMKLLIDGIPNSDRTVYEKAIGELDKLVGLTEVKELIREQIELARFQHIRRQRGFKTEPISLNYIFTGNPGTGKTTVAKIVGSLNHSIGLLPKGQVIVSGRADLVGKFSGHTAPNVRDKFNEALGGTLFIDEAYSLAPSEHDDYGKEALATLVQEVEEKRGKLSCICAGYTREMKQFIDANSGIKSRFTVIMEFPDYSNGELVQIMRGMCIDNDYRVSREFLAATSVLMAAMKMKEEKNFGNGRVVRNAFEAAERRMAMRVSGKLDVPGNLTDFKPEDLPFKKEFGYEASDFDLSVFKWKIKDGQSEKIVGLKQLPTDGQFPELAEDSIRTLQALILNHRLEQEPDISSEDSDASDDITDIRPRESEPAAPPTH